MLMVGGFVWLTAGGSGEKVSQAQSMIKGSLTGLILTMGAYTLLKTVNPALVDFKIDDITIIKKINELADNRIGAKAEEYKTLSCNTDYSQGVKFYATGYTKPDKKDYSNDDFLCMVAMNCSCPGNKIDKNRNCDHLFPNNKNYHPCEPFTGDDYCNKNSSGKVPQAGDIAVDPACFRENDQFCVQKEGSSDATYTAKDAGGSIKGRRIDIWSENVNAANKNSGVVTVTLGPCK
jgi:3D (Asp-Asp-Asp) domain-containing protein